MVALQDEEYHRMLRRPFASIYSANRLLPAEHLVDSSVEILIKRLSCLVGDENIDFGFWIQLYVFDVLCQITFSKRLGFLDRGEDIGGMLELVWKQFHEGAPVRSKKRKSNPLASALHNFMSKFYTNDIMYRLARCLGQITFGERTL